MGWGGLALIIVSCTQVGEATPYPGTTALLPVLGTALVIGAGCATPDLGVGRFLSKPAMRSVGRLSYSWYLWHWPALLLAPALFGGDIGLAGRLAMVVVSFGLAILTLHLIENPVRFAPALRLSAERSLAVGGALTAVAVCVGAVLLMMRPIPVGHGTAAAPVAPPAPTRPSAEAPPPMSVRDQVLAAVAKATEIRPVPTNLTPPLGAIVKPDVFVNGCVLSWRDVEQPDCVSGDAGAPTTVALVGDSHAAMWQPALEPIAQERHWRLQTMSKVLCPLRSCRSTAPIWAVSSPSASSGAVTCSPGWRRSGPQLIVLDMSRRYGADFGFTSYDQAWLDSMTRLVQRLRATGANVLVLGQLPDPHSTVPTCVSAHMDNAAECSPARTVALNDAGIAAEAAATAAGGGQYAGLSELFCTADRCPVIVGNTLVYRDDNHVTTEYARVFAPLLAEHVEGALSRSG